MDLFTDEKGNQLPWVIGVDEFSKLVDLLEGKLSKMNEIDRKSFKTAIARSFKNLLCRNPLRFFVFTGFNEDLRTFLNWSDAPVEEFRLDSCDVSSSKPLLVEIKTKYEEEGFRVPLDVLEVVKTTPGLVGYWYERVFVSKALDSSFKVFSSSIPWCTDLVDNSIRNWEILIEYLLACEGYQLPTLSALELVDRVIAHSLGAVDKHGRIDISGFVITVLVHHSTNFVTHLSSPTSNYRDFSTEHVSLLKHVITALQAVITSCQMRKEKIQENCNNGSSKSLQISADPDSFGGAFESFVYHAFRARIALANLYPFQIRKNVQNNDDHMSKFVRFSFFSLLGMDCSGICWSKFADVEINLHCTYSRSGLSQMLNRSLYPLFPLGLEGLAEPNPEFILSRWHQDCIVEGKTDMRDKKLFLHRAFLEFSFDPVSVVKIDGPEPDETVAALIREKVVELAEQRMTSKRKKKSQTTTELDDVKEEGEKKEGLYNYRYKSFIQSIIDTTDHIMKLFLQRQVSFFPLANSAKGADLLIMGYGASEVGDHVLDLNKIELIVVIELKDSKTTSAERWTKKLEALKSYKCIIPYLIARFNKIGKTCRYHIVMAGRENTISKGKD